MSVKASCKALDISPSGYYAWKDRPISVSQMTNEQISAKVIEWHQKSRQTYGVPRITAALKAEGFTCNQKRIYRLMKANGLQGIQRRRYRVRTTDSQHNLPIASRVFKTEQPITHPNQPNQVWVTDISYLMVGAQFQYLAVVMDVFTRKIVGYAVADHMQTD
jgi:transposase InsO family protein